MISDAVSGSFVYSHGNAKGSQITNYSLLLWICYIFDGSTSRAQYTKVLKLTEQ